MTLPADPLAWAVKEFRNQHSLQYRTYRDYMEGRHPMKYDSEHYRRAFGDRFHHFFYNRCASVVDAHSDRMRVVGFGSDDEDARREAVEAGQQVEQEDKTLAQLAADIWDANDMDNRENQIDAEMFGLGDSYLMVEVDPSDGDVYLWPQEAEQVRVHYDDMKPGRIDLAAKAWTDEEDYTRLNLYFTDRIEKYRTTQRTLTAFPTSSKIFEQYQPDGEAWPVMLAIKDTVPVFHFANNGRVNSYGVSELRDILPLQDMLNKEIINGAIASELRANQQWLLLNYQMSDDPEERAEFQRLQVGVTTMLAIPPNAEGEAEPRVAEFSAADLRQMDLVAEKWDVRISRQSRVPVRWLLGESGSNESGVSKRYDVSQFTSKIEDRQRAAGAVYQVAIAYALRCDGVAVEPGDIRVNWKPAAALGEQESWEIGEIQQRVGLPQRQIFKERGYEPEQLAAIAQMKAEEDARAFSLIGDAGNPLDDEDTGAIA